MPELKDALELYAELHEYVRHHLNSLMADENVSNIEVAEECEKMPEVMGVHAFQLLAIGDDPVMLPVYGLMCTKIAHAINKVMVKEARG